LCQINKNALHPPPGKDEERFTLLSWYHLLALMPCDINLVEYEHTPARYRGHPAEVYFRK